MCLYGVRNHWPFDSLLIVFESLGRCLDLLRQRKWKFSSRTSETSNLDGAWIFAKYSSLLLDAGPLKSLNVNVLWQYLLSNFQIDLLSLEPREKTNFCYILVSLKFRGKDEVIGNQSKRIYLSDQMNQSGMRVTQVWEFCIIRAFATKGFTRSSSFNWYSRFLPFTANSAQFTEKECTRSFHVG